MLLLKSQHLYVAWAHCQLSFLCCLGVKPHQQQWSYGREWKQKDETTALKELKRAVLLKLNINILHLDGGFLLSIKLQDFVS